MWNLLDFENAGNIISVSPSELSDCQWEICVGWKLGCSHNLRERGSCQLLWGQPMWELLIQVAEEEQDGQEASVLYQPGLHQAYDKRWSLESHGANSTWVITRLFKGTRVCSSGVLHLASEVYYRGCYLSCAIRAPLLGRAMLLTPLTPVLGEKNLSID